MTETPVHNKPGSVAEEAEPRSRQRWANMVLVLIGLSHLLLLGYLLQAMAPQRTSTGWFDLTVWGLVALVHLGLGLALVLYPLRQYRPVGLLIRLALWPVTIAAIAGRYSAFVFAVLLTLMLALVLPFLVWFAVRLIWLPPSPINPTVLYVTLVVSSLVLTNRGDTIVRFILLTWLGEKGDYSKLFLLLRPNLVRVYIYAIMAAAYSLANFEEFAGIAVILAPWWIAYKDVLVEVLLTYVAFDSVAVAWRERKEGKPGNPD